MLIVTAAIIQSNGRILSARKKDGLPLAGLWEFPGGKVEQGETPEQSLKRELAEELGIQCSIGRYFGQSIFADGTKVVQLLGYIVTPTSYSFSLTDHDEIRWLTPEELTSVDWAPADLPLVEKLQAQAITDRTLNYYENNAAKYISQTMDSDMEPVYEKFTGLLPPNAHILDLGCGSGRDSKAFLDKGFAVTAIDGSPAIAAITSRFLRQKVIVCKAQELNYREEFEGIWACASLLHLPESEFGETLTRIILALKPLGILYISLKKVKCRKWDSRGRFFNSLSGKEIAETIRSLKRVKFSEIFETSSKMNGREEVWLNFLVRKTG